MGSRRVFVVFARTNNCEHKESVSLPAAVHRVNRQTEAVDLQYRLHFRTSPHS